MLLDVDIDEVSNFFNILFKNKLQYKLLVIFYLFVFQRERVNLLIQILIKEFLLCNSFYIYFYNYMDLYELEFI